MQMSGPASNSTRDSNRRQPALRQATRALGASASGAAGGREFEFETPFSG